MTEQSGARVLSGSVTSDKGDKTIVVSIERRVKHPIYKKYIRRSTKIHAHDPENQAKIGDLVEVQECAPISKKKTWKLVAIKERAEQK